MWKFIIVSFLFNFIILQTTAQASCGQNEQFYDASRSPTCDYNCQDLNRPCRLTTERAVAGCYCRPGYARNLRQACILITECAADCFPNELPIRPRKRACENSCSGTRMRNTICYSAEARKCVCAQGYCRNQRAECVRDFA